MPHFAVNARRASAPRSASFGRMNARLGAAFARTRGPRLRIERKQGQSFTRHLYRRLRYVTFRMWHNSRKIFTGGGLGFSCAGLWWGLDCCGWFRLLVMGLLRLCCVSPFQGLPTIGRPIVQCEGQKLAYTKGRDIGRLWGKTAAI